MYSKEQHNTISDMKVSDMKVGDEGYCVPWAITLTPQNELYIDTGYTVDVTSTVTSTVRIKRLVKGFKVVIKKDESYCWVRSHLRPCKNYVLVNWIINE